MSELKSYKLFHRASALTSPEFLSVVEFGNGDEVYDKDEADKVIADLEESHKMEVEQLLMEIVELKQKINESQTELELWRDGSIISEAHQKEIDEKRHSDYKWCLAMAKECEATALWCYQAANTLPTGFKATLFGKPVMIEPRRLYNRFGRLMKWNNRWLKIAEQFKEAK